MRMDEYREKTIVFALASLNLLTLDIAQIHLALHSLNRRFLCIL